VAVYLAGRIARLLYELSDAVDALRDVWHLSRVILQFIEFPHQCWNSFTQLVHYRKGLFQMILIKLHFMYPQRAKWKAQRSAQRDKKGTNTNNA